MVEVRAEPSGDGWSCEVSVDEGAAHTRHMVRVSHANVERWAKGSDRRDVEDLVVRSFEFLLEREPPGSILASFDLSVIQRYFPEYDSTFTRKAI